MNRHLTPLALVLTILLGSCRSARGPAGEAEQGVLFDGASIRHLERGFPDIAFRLHESDLEVEVAKSRVLIVGAAEAGRLEYTRQSRVWTFATPRGPLQVKDQSLQLGSNRHELQRGASLVLDNRLNQVATGHDPSN